MPIIPHDDDLLDFDFGDRGGLDLPPAVERIDVRDPLDIGRRGPPEDVRPAVERNDVPNGRARGLAIWDWERQRGRGRGPPRDPPGRAIGLEIHDHPAKGRGRGGKRK